MKADYFITPERQAALHRIRDSHHGESSAVQRNRLLAAIQQLGSVTTFESQRHLDIADPRPRKLELVRQGHPIELTWAHLETEAGVVHRVGRYFIARQKKEEATK